MPRSRSCRSQSSQHKTFSFVYFDLSGEWVFISLGEQRHQEIFGGRRDKDSGQRRTNREKEVEEVVSVSLEDDRLNKNICTLLPDRRFSRGKRVEKKAQLGWNTIVIEWPTRNQLLQMKPINAWGVKGVKMRRGAMHRVGQKTFRQARKRVACSQRSCRDVTKLEKQKRRRIMRYRKRSCKRREKQRRARMVRTAAASGPVIST